MPIHLDRRFRPRSPREPSAAVRAEGGVSDCLAIARAATLPDDCHETSLGGHGALRVLVRRLVWGGASVATRRWPYRLGSPCVAIRLRRPQNAACAGT